jgi:23S rRNA pseudouridine2605 synthase
MEERLQKILSAHGVCSRRTAEEYLKQGRISVNGIVAELGDKADPDKDLIALDGKSISAAPDRRTYLMLYKPRGYVTTLSDEKGRKTVASIVENCGSRVWPVGRLDMASEGLLLMTDDGDFTNLMTHPRHEKEKEYMVWVEGALTEERLGALSKPMVLDGQKLRPAQVRKMGDGVILVVIHEGKTDR